MTPQEFKAWFEGFTEAFTGCPRKAQWTRIKERVSEIDGKPVTERVYVDRYLPYYTRPALPYWTYLSNGLTACGTSVSTTNTLAQNASLQANYANAGQNCSNQFNGVAAMALLGREEAKKFAA